MARASLEELRLDYEDFLRQRGLPKWVREDPRRVALINRRCATADEVAQWVKEIHDGPNGTHGQNVQSTVSTKPTRSTYSEIAANAALILIAVACGLLDRQLAAQADAFEKDGGFTERLYQRRVQARRKR